MATTRFNANILEAARRLKDQRTSAGTSEDSSKRYKSAVLSAYQNRAVRDIIRETYEALGEAFGDVIPEQVKTSGTLSLTAGVVAKPSDAWYALDLVKSDRTVKFWKLPHRQVEDVLTGSDGLIVPSATRPVFWEEGQNVKTNGLTSGNVIMKYVRAHQDISVITSATGNGTIYTTANDLTWTAATKTLTVALQAGLLTSADVNKLLMFRTSGIVYVGRIESVSGDLDVVLFGDGLPAGNIAVPNIIEFVVSDLQPDGNDLTLNAEFDGEIVDRMIEFGLKDAQAGII